MLCDICQTRQAKIFYTEIVNGQKKEQHLCEQCASEYTAVPINDILGGQGLSSIGSILSGILSSYSKAKGKSLPSEKRGETTCPECGTSESEFLKTGRTGCPVCYNVSLGKKMIATSIPNNNIERAVHNEGQFVDIIATMTKRLQDSKAAWKYQCKRELIGKLCDLAAAAYSGATAYANYADTPTNVVEGTYYDANAVVDLSKIPSREVLLAQLVGSLQGPMQKLAATLQALKEKKEEEAA